MLRLSPLDTRSRTSASQLLIAVRKFRSWEIRGVGGTVDVGVIVAAEVAANAATVLRMIARYQP